MTHSYYPVALDLKGKRCLVAGGGTIATDKVEGLRLAEAEIVVVAHSVTARIADLAESGEIELRVRPYRPDDLEGVYLAYGATDDKEVNGRVAADARDRGVLANAVDDIPNCDFFAVSVVRRGDLQIAISTNGVSPAFARWMREYLEAWLPAEIGDLLSVLADVRRELKAQGPIPAYQYWEAAIDDEVLLRLRHDDRDGARERVRTALLDGQEQCGQARRHLPHHASDAHTGSPELISAGLE